MGQWIHIIYIWTVSSQITTAEDFKHCRKVSCKICLFDTMLTNHLFVSCVFRIVVNKLKHIIMKYEPTLLDFLWVFELMDVVLFVLFLALQDNAHFERDQGDWQLLSRKVWLLQRSRLRRWGHAVAQVLGRHFQVHLQGWVSGQLLSQHKLVWIFLTPFTNELARK